MPAVLVLREHRHRLDEFRQRLFPVLLEEALTVDPFRHADHAERPILQVRQHEAPHLRQIHEEIALADGAATRARIGRPVDAVEIGECYARPAHLQVHALRRILQLLQHRRGVVRRSTWQEGFVHVLALPADTRCPGVGGRRGCGGRPFPRGRALAHATRCDVFAQAHEYRRTQRACRRPLAEGDLGDEFRLQPGRRPVQRRLLGKG